MNFANVTSKIEWEPGAQEKIKNMPDNVVYTIARITLDTTYQHIPLSNNKNAGKLRQTSMDAGVRGSNGDYYIGSYTDYAKYVWNMGDGTKWSTPGTFGKWYEEVFKQNYSKIVNTALERNKLK